MRHICIACGKNITKNKYHFENMGPYHKPTCPQCNNLDLKFSSWEEHLEHVRTVHNGIFKPHCGKCGKLFKNELDLKVHKRKVHRREPLKSTVCPQCGKEVVSIANHTEDVHGTQPSTCDVCGRVCKHPNSLRRHMNNNHKIAHNCDKCDKTFNQKYHLTMHQMRVHTDNEEKPYKCLICYKGFATKQILSRHNTNVHKGQARDLHMEQTHKQYDSEFNELPQFQTQ